MLTTYEATLCSAFNRLPTNAQNDIRNTLKSKQPILVGRWAFTTPKKNKACGCLMMDGLADKYYQHRHLHSNSMMPPLHETEWVAHYYNTSESCISEFAQAFDNWANSKWNHATERNLYKYTRYGVYWLNRTGRMRLLDILPNNDEVFQWILR